MTTPNRSQVHVNRPLTNISVAYAQNAENFIATRVFPIIPVAKQSDLYFVFNRSDFNRDEIRQRAPGTESAGGGYTLSTDSYLAKVYAFHKDIDDQTRANYDSPLRPDQEATEYVTRKVLIGREGQFASTHFATSKWGTDYAGVSGAPNAGEFRQWSDAANSDPIADIQVAKTAMLEKTGYEPNVLTLGKKAYDALLRHPDILDRVRYGGSNSNPAIVSRQLLASLFELDEILIMKGIRSTDAEPGPSNATAGAEFIGGNTASKAALLTYRPSAPGLMTPSAGYTFAWEGYAGLNIDGTSISSFRMEQLKADRIEVEAAYDMKQVGKELGAFFATAVA